MFKSLMGSSNTSDFLYNLAVALLSIVISSFVLMYLWNRVMVQYITVCRPIKGLLDAFLLSLTISILRGY